MTTKNDGSSAVVCAENIVLLSMLNETPDSPHSNPLAVTKGKKKKAVQRVLSIEQESRLARTFSFLSAVTDDPNHIVATCIEEFPTGDGMRVVLAINKKSSDSSEKALDRIKRGLDGIFKLLSRAQASPGNAEHLHHLNTEISEAIIHMCKDRILTRLGYQAAYQPLRKKSPLAGVLSQTINAVQTHYRKRPTSEVGAFLQQATNLVTLLRVWDGPSTDEQTAQQHLRTILLSISHLTKAVNLANLLSPVPFPPLEPGIQKSLPHRLSKLAKYHTSSIFLLKAATSIPLFQNIQIHPISLPPIHFSRDLTIPPKTSSLPNRLSQCKISTPHARISQKLDTTPAKANTSFLKALTTSLREAKVHAEVQIVAHYELHPTPLRPRVIASSKDACYLCNVFIAAHGGFCVPRTHGRLYRGWRIPGAVPGLEGVQRRMNLVLEARIRNAVLERMALEKWTIMHPNESTGWTVGGSMETLRGLVPLGVNMGQLLTSPREEELAPPPNERNTTTAAPAGEQPGTEPEQQLVPEPITDKDDPSRSSTSNRQPMSDISTGRTTPVEEGPTASKTAPSVLLISPPSPVHDSPLHQNPSTNSLSKKTPSPEPPPSQEPAASASTREAPTTNSPARAIPSQNHQADTPLPRPFSPEQPVNNTPTQPPPAKPNPSTSTMSSRRPSQHHPSRPPSPERYISPLLPQAIESSSSALSEAAPPISKPKINSSSTKIITLIQNQPLIHRLHPPNSTSTCHVYTTGSIDVHPSYAHPSDQNATTQSGVVDLRICWLPDEVAARMLRRRTPGMTDVEGLPAGREVDSGSRERGYLVRGREVVLVEVVRR